MVSLQVYVIDAINPQGYLHRVHRRIPGVQYFLEHHHGYFYALTNQLPRGNNILSTGNYYLIRCRVQDVQEAKWEVNLNVTWLHMFRISSMTFLSLWLQIFSIKLCDEDISFVLYLYIFRDQVSMFWKHGYFVVLITSFFSS